MGCDIHAYVEYTKDKKNPYWENLTRNFGARNYALFAALAGVRGELGPFGPKGMPEGELGYYTGKDYWVAVAPPHHPEWASGEGWTSIETAQKWVDGGGCEVRYKEDGSLRSVSNPDYHSHSWLTTDELEQALDHYVSENVYREGKAPSDWRALLVAMRSLESDGYLTRIVFWFDN